MISSYAKIKKLDKETTAIEFWENNSLRFPVVYELFKIYQSVPSMSTSPERVFSVF
jgi:hypothetical protein